jgi:hypothetical protein
MNRFPVFAPTLPLKRLLQTTSLFVVTALAVFFSATRPSPAEAVLSDPAWQLLPAANVGPAGRAGAAMVYDRGRQRVILFGGQSGAYLNDTWAFNLATLTWQELATGSATRPPARFSMVYGIDYLRNRLLITTGQGTEFYNDVWAFDLVTDTWSQVSAGGGPAPRYGAAGGVFDGHLLYVTHGFTNQGRYDDTWVFNTATNQWIQVTPGSNRPLPRCLHTAAMPNGHSLVLFGGCASPIGPCPLEDTWVYEATNGSWTEIGQGNHPAKRTFASMAAVGSSQQLLLFGGEGTTGALNDLWLLDVPAGQWTPLNPTGTPPPASSNHSMVWIDGPADQPENGYMLLFGGGLNQLWMLLPNGVEGVTGVTLAGPTSSLVQADVTITAAVTPGSAALPITYQWTATDHSLQTHTTGIATDQATFHWTTPGTKTVTVTAANATGQAVSSRTVQILVPSHFVYMPVVRR